MVELDVLPGAALELDWAVVRQLRDVVVDRLSSHRVPEAHQREHGRDIIRRTVTSWVQEQVSTGFRPASAYTAQLQQAIFDAVFGLGRLQPLLRADVENIEIHGSDTTWLRLQSGQLVRGPAVADSDEELVAELQFLASRAGRSLSASHPRLHMELPDGSRLAAVIATTRRPQVVIRRHLLQSATVEELVAKKAMTPGLAQFLGGAVRARRNIVVCGGQNSGKTTLIRSLAGLIPAHERWATAEQEYELHLDKLGRHPHLVAFQAREGGSEIGVDGRAAGEVSLQEIVRDSLRMNLSRIVVGEVRGSEVVPMLDAMSTGDGGSMCTLHARSAHDAVERLVVLCGRYGVAPEVAYRWIAGSVDLIVHLQMWDETAVGGARTRFVGHVAEVVGMGEGGRPALNDLFHTPGGTGEAVPTGIVPQCAEELRRAGFDLGWLQVSPSANGGLW
ncbi:CpaF family protein [Nocardiopsis sp. CNT312]|uniref:CpaF family protein n=1 Tax=Nocardiopsis sp. CNT312 TaxID=1137268 RepID=UPI000491BD41|nr:ATPase, T2SS/T4P/T4SS family [Nocardiopsis sp. CNT312]